MCDLATPLNLTPEASTIFSLIVTWNLKEDICINNRLFTSKPVKSEWFTKARRVFEVLHTPMKKDTVGFTIALTLKDVGDYNPDEQPHWKLEFLKDSGLINDIDEQLVSIFLTQRMLGNAI